MEILLCHVTCKINDVKDSQPTSDPSLGMFLCRRATNNDVKDTSSFKDLGSTLAT